MIDLNSLSPVHLAALGGAASVALPLAAWLAIGKHRRRTSSRASSGVDASGLVPREQFAEVLQDRLIAAERQQLDCCVLHVGLDNLRFLRDLAGADATEALQTATVNALREVVGPSTPLSRVAQEEFALCMNASREAAEKLASRITAALAKPLLSGTPDLELSVSVGVAVASEHGSDLHLLGKAVAATRAVQRDGGGAHATFDPRIGAAQTNELSLARDLREALARGNLELFYQPKVHARQLEVTSVEALLRWRHPGVGLVSPSQFVPVAERQGLMDSLGQWVIEDALRQAELWRKIDLPFGVSINIAGAQLRRDDFAQRLARSIKARGLPATAITCEILETDALEDTTATREALARLHKTGVRIAVAGFMGQPEALATLHRLPVHEIKVDRQLIAALSRDVDSFADLRRIVETAHAAGVRVVAEGIENEAQRNQAVRLGCDEVQGHLFAKPMSARAVGIWSANSSQNLQQSLRPSQFKDTAPMVA